MFRVMFHTSISGRSAVLALASIAALASAALATGCSESLPYEPKPQCDQWKAQTVPETTYVDAQGAHTIFVAKLCGWPTAANR